MARLMDMGQERLKNLLIQMGQLSEKTVSIAIEGYSKGANVRNQVFDNSEELRVKQEEVNDLATELLARYQPVASDLRFITSSMEIAYGFSRFGRYAYDIADVLSIFRDISDCDKSEVDKAAKQATEMIRLSIKAFTERDITLAGRLAAMDNVVDDLYRNYLRRMSKEGEPELKCYLSGTLILRYIERIADHAEDVGEAVAYTVTGKRPPHTQVA
jgi:phosphate transport system protein